MFQEDQTKLWSFCFSIQNNSNRISNIEVWMKRNNTDTTMGTTGRFGKSTPIIISNCNVLNPIDFGIKFKAFFFFFSSLSRDFFFFFGTKSAYERTDYSEIFNGFLVVMIFFLTVLGSFILFLFVLWLRERFCRTRTIRNH